MKGRWRTDKRIRIASVSAAALMALAVPGMAGAAPSADSSASDAPVIVEYPAHRPLSTPCEVEFDKNGYAWVQEAVGNAVTRLDPKTGELKPFPLKTPAAQPGGMEFDEDGYLWFSEVVGNNVVRLDPADGSMQYYPIPVTNTQLDSLPYGIRATIDTAIKDGGVWMTMAGANAIGRFDMDTHDFTQYPLPTPAAVPLIIQDGPGDLLVFSEALGNKIGTIDVKTKEIREYAVPTPASVPQGVTTAPDGTIWWSGTGGQQLGTLDVKTGKVTEIPLLPLRKAGPLDIGLGNPLPFPGPVRVGDNGKVYFAEGNLVLGGNKIGEYDPKTKTLKEYETPTPLSAPCDLNNQVPGQIHFGEFTGNRVGRLIYAS